MSFPGTKGQQQSSKHSARLIGFHGRTAADEVTIAVGCRYGSRSAKTCYSEPGAGKPLAPAIGRFPPSPSRSRRYEAFFSTLLVAVGARHDLLARRE